LELQAVPAELRRVFVADDGYVLLEADFSQIELRVLAHFSNEPLLLAAYTGDDNEVDIHRRTAALALGIDESDVNQQQRNDVGKAINFGIVFGQTEYGLAGKLGIGVQEAASFIEAFFVGYPAVRQWIKSVRRETQRRGAVETLYGRRRRLADATCADDRLRERAFRQSVNTIIQGTAADINKMALARLHKALPDDCHLLLTVHDSVLMEVPKRRAKRLAALVRQVMEEPPPKFDVPLVVSVNYGPSWGRSR
jgi:DNA polymerase-1